MRGGVEGRLEFFRKFIRFCSVTLPLSTDLIFSFNVFTMYGIPYIHYLHKVMLLITEVKKYEESGLEYSCGLFGRPTSSVDFPASVLEPGSGGVDDDQRSKIEIKLWVYVNWDGLKLSFCRFVGKLSLSNSSSLLGHFLISSFGSLTAGRWKAKLFN